MRALINIGLGTVLLAGLAVSANTASAALRCGTELVVEGDSKQALLDVCGEPDEGRPQMHTDVWVYRIDGEEYRVRVFNDTVARIDAPEMSKEAPPDSPDETSSE